MLNEYFPLKINKQEQWIAIRGNSNKAILLTLHGGPGTPSMGFFRGMNKELEKEFLLVTWDQRGTGRSIKNLDATTINLEQLIQDARFLTKYLQDRFKEEKIFILAHSFGTVLGLLIAKRYPEDYRAYFAVSQQLNLRKSEELIYVWLIEQATKKNHKKILKILEVIGKPIDGGYKGGSKGIMKIRSLVSKYNGDVKNGSINSYLLKYIFFSREYGGFRFFPAIKAMFLSLDLLYKDLKGIDLSKEVISVDIPIYFFGGKYDYNTPQSIVKEYVEKVEAPHKEYIEFENSAHNLLWEENEKFNKLLYFVSNQNNN